jgi:hypothetical protein
LPGFFVLDTKHLSFSKRMFKLCHSAGEMTTGGGKPSCLHFQQFPIDPELHLFLTPAHVFLKFGDGPAVLFVSS